MNAFGYAYGVSILQDWNVPQYFKHGLDDTTTLI